VTALPSGLVALDEQMRSDHCYLGDADCCHCLAEYLPGRCTAANRINQLIANLKCPPSIATTDPRRRRYKLQAIGEVARALRAAVSQSWVECATWVPIPTSRPPPDADYDDRLQRVLRQAFVGYALDMRSLLYQSEITAADHASLRRSSFAVLYGLIRLDRQLLARAPLRDRIVLFDDVLTTGKHYKCCERRLREAPVQIPISGLFIARRILAGSRRGGPPPAHAGTTRVLTVPWRPISSAMPAAMMPVAPAKTKAST
jgi:predicted amidophosphoribosyltransferase